MKTRIVLSERHRPKAERIIDETGIDNLSQLFTLLLINYGDKLVKALKED